MNSRILSIVRLVLFSVIVISLIVLLVLNLKARLETTTEKLFIAIFIMMIIWGSVRIVASVRDLIK